MNIPEFTAEASLYRTSNSYRFLTFDRASPERTVLVPQLGGPGFKGYWGCIDDCVDQHPNWKAARCREYCRRDPGVTSSGGSSPGYGPSCENSPPAECAYLHAGCCLLGLFECIGVCAGLHQTCLENSRRECRIARHGPLVGGSSYPRSQGVGVQDPGDFGNQPPPPPPVNNCIFGGAPCGPKCCPPGLQCCSYSPQFGADSRTSCLH